MKAKLTTLPNEPRGGAWPSSARTVRRPVKSGNERDPCPYLSSISARKWDTLRGPLAISKRKERATIGQYAPNLPGYTRTAMAGTMGPNFERRRKSRKPVPVRIEGCNSPS